jgi:hypothetical protein
VRLTVLNLTDKVALYNFLSTFQRHALRAAAHRRGGSQMDLLTGGTGVHTLGRR